MKRKLALLLALVMILSLVPMAAFADGPASRYSSTVDVDKTSVVADGTAAAKFTVYLLKSNGTAAVGENVYFASKRGGEETFTYKNSAGDFVAATEVGSTGTYYAPVSNSTGKMEIKVKSSTPGEAKFAFGITQEDLVSYLNGKDISDLEVGLIGTKTLTFTAASAGVVEILTATPASGVKANGIDYYEVTVKVSTEVEDANGNKVAGRPVSGETVKLSANKSAVTFNADEKTTNAAGIATFKVYSTKPETVKIEASAAGKTSAEKALTFIAGGLYGIERISSDNQVIAKDSTNKAFKLKVTDASGNMVKLGYLDANGNVVEATDANGSIVDNENHIKAEVIDEPDDSSISLDTTAYGDGHLKIKVDKVAYEGAYKLRISLGNGKYQEINFTVKKQGTPTRIEIAYDEVALSLEATSTTPSIDRYDANDVKKSVDVGGKIKLISSNPGLISVNADGSLKVETDESKDVGKEVTLTVIDEENKLTATTTMKIAGSVAGFNAKAPATTTVGADAKVDIEFVDADGNVVAIGDGKGATLSSFVVLSKPEGAIVSVEEGTDFEADAEAVGTTYVNVNSNKAGDVKVQLIITANNSKTYTQSVTVKFGAAPSDTPVAGAKALILNIGSTTGFADGNVVTSDTASFIKDGRTFVPVRFIAEQLGAEVSFTTNAEGKTETVTLTRPDLTVTMTMGSTAIVVVKDGVSSTITADVAPYVTAEGRTVLPFRALAEAMGAKVSFGPEGGAVQWVKFEQ